ncbi:signal recognition particle receptor subunit alpha [Enterococcus lactis]|nr:signal recognition particle receptor subunit alpha [Enterococcus lactis]
MAFESLTERLQQAMGKLRKKGKVSEADVKEMMREIRLALLEADVNLQVVKDFTKRVRERGRGRSAGKFITCTTNRKIVDEELTITLGSETAELNKSPKIPTVIMMAGLQGAGKTTFYR